MGGEGGRRCRVQVNSEQVSPESLAGAGERLCGPESSAGRSCYHCDAKQRSVVTLLFDIWLLLAMAVAGVQLR